MKFELKRIAVWPAVKISFIMNLVMGFLIGIFYAFVFAMLLTIPSAMMNPDMAPLTAISGVFLVMIPFIMSISMAVFNTIFVVICVVAYNFFARIAGGMEFEYTQLADVAPVMSSSAVPPSAPAAPDPKPESPAAPHSPFSPPHNEPPQDYAQ